MKSLIAYIQINVKQQGFTLIELLTALLVIAFTLGIGAPTLIGVINEGKLTAQANDMIATLNVARSEAVKRNQTVTVRKLLLTWDKGWTVFVDLNSDGINNGGDILIKSYPDLGANSVTMNSSFVNFVSYVPNGRVNMALGGNFRFCPAAGIDSSRRVVVAGTGRMRTEKGNYAANCP